MRKGLTLMELLTVISILATLAALLYPVYLNVRSRMHATSCANQLRQIGVAIKMYVEEQGDGTPYSMPYPLGELYPHYVSDRELLICPRVRALVPHEIMEGIRQTKLWGFPRSTYWGVSPKGLDSIAEKDPDVSFSEVFAKRGDMTPIVLCEFHRYCNPHKLAVGPKALAWVKANCLNDRDIFLSPGGPLVILRWGGNVDLVYKGVHRFQSTSILLLDY